MKVLMLAKLAYRKRSSVGNHLIAFKKYSENNIWILDVDTVHFSNIDLDWFDAVVIHFSIVIAKREFLPEALADRIRDYNGYKVLFIQDEYRWVDATVTMIEHLGIDVLYSVTGENAVDKIYHHDSIKGLRRKTTLTGFVTESLVRARVPEYSRRSIDVGYRALKLSAWLGAFAQEKWRIGERFRNDAEGYGLQCDIGLDAASRLYGRRWPKFLSRCKAVLGTESGASFTDFSGNVQRQVEAYEASHPGALFEEIQRKFLGEKDGNITIRVISPRIFEAAALRTLMILYPGDYSGVLTAWRHYVPLERDHSNMDEVVGVLQDARRAQQIIDNAYREVALNPRYSYRALVEDFEADIDQHALAKKTQCANGCENAGATSPRPSRLASDLYIVKMLAIATLRIQGRAMLRWPYVTYSWTVATIVPERWQPAVRRAVRRTAERFGLI